MSTAYQDQVMWNGILRSADAVRISPLSDGVMFGRGLFETVRVVRGRPAFLPAHRERLQRSCVAVGLQWDVEEHVLRNRCLDVIGANALAAGALKIMVLADEGGAGELIATREWTYPNQKYEVGFVLSTRTCARLGRRASGPLVKTTSYLEHLLAREKAKAAGADDALWVDAEGQVLEGSATNIFAVVGGRILTPPEEFGILPGIVRGEILKRAKARAVEAVPVSEDLLSRAEEVFVTNALAGVMPVSAIDTQVYDLRKYEVTRQLMGEYQEWIVDF